MTEPSYGEIALRYCVDDLRGACLPGARLQGILHCLQLGKPVTPLALGFLQKEGLHCLYSLATGQLTYDAFRAAAFPEQANRIEVAVAAKQAEEAESRARTAAMHERSRLALERIESARRARESDPEYIAGLRQKELRARYGIFDYVERECLSRLMTILGRVDSKQRVSEDDFFWLSTVGEDYFTNALLAAYHRLEADFFAVKFKRTRDPWAAVNASGHYRKCSCPVEADALLEAISVDHLTSKKLQSALCTTRGGVKRDLQCWDDALRLGAQAHQFKPDDFRPCTLLGAIHIEMGNFVLGQEWYAMAVERGATIESVDNELRSIFFRVDQAKQEELRAFLLQEDPIRFGWAKPTSHKQRRRA